jgi:hypothetical protein
MTSVPSMGSSDPITGDVQNLAISGEFVVVYTQGADSMWSGPKPTASSTYPVNAGAPQ